MMSSSPEEFTIHVEGKTLVCDKAILREGSEYFRAMFDSNMIESRANETTLQDQSYEVVKTLVDSMKTGELEISDNVEELVEGATMLQVGSAIKSCTTYLEGTLDDSNCLSLTKFSETFGLDSVYNLAKRHSLYYFNKVVKHEEFLSLGQQELIDYLSEKYLNVETELNVLDAIDLWVNSNSANEKTESLAAILECFHPEDLMQGEWEEAVKKPVLADTKAGKQWLESNPKPSSTTEQQYRDLPVMFLTVGGIKTDFQCADADSPVTDICRFDPEEKCFKPFRSLHDIYPEVGNKMGYSICTFERYMYISGGQADLLRQVYETKVWRFDSFTLKWEHLTDMPSCRRHHGTCASEGSYFVLGGFGKFRKCLDTFEEYDIEQDIWKQLPTIPKGVCKYEAVLYNQRIFIFANTSHYYDIGTKSWVDIIPANLRTPVYPLVYNKCVYTFPKLEYSDDLDYDFFRAKKVLLLCGKYDKSCEKINTIRYSYNFQLGGNVVVVKKRFFTIQWLNKDDQLQLASAFMEDLENFTLLSDSSVSGCRVKRPYLVALPFFPDIRQQRVKQDTWNELPCLPQSIFSMEVTKLKNQLFVFKDVCFCFNFTDQTWTQLNSCLQPLQYHVCFSNMLYLFPKDGVLASGIIFEENPPNTQLEKIYTRPLEPEGSFYYLSASEKLNRPCTNIVTLGKRFYYLQRPKEDGQDPEFVSGCFEDFEKCHIISSCLRLETEFTTLVLLHHYPVFKCASASLLNDRS